MDCIKCLLGGFCFIQYYIVSVHGYTNVDLKLDVIYQGTSIDPSTIGDITVKGDSRRKSVDTIIGDLLNSYNAKVVATANPPPTKTTDEEACVLGVGFLSPLESLTEKPFPSKKECNHEYQPIIGDGDEILKYPRCIKYSEFETLDFSKFIQEHELRTKCGRYRLVGMLDPLRQVQNDTNVCNNFISFDINFNCSSYATTEPTCELNTDGDDVTLTYKNHVRPRAMYGQQTMLRHAMQRFKQTEMSPEWIEEFEKGTDVVGKYGKMVMKIVKAYIQGLPKESYAEKCLDDTNDAKEWVRRQLNEMQGLNKENTMSYTNNGNVTNYKQLLQVIKTIVKNLKNESQLHNITERLRTELQRYMNVHNQTGIEAMREAITEMINIVRDHKQEIAKKNVAKEVCAVANKMDMVKKLMSETLHGSHHHVASGDMHETFIKTTFKLAVKLMFYYPEFYDTCYENILMHLHGVLKQNSSKGNETWMYEEEFQQRLLDYRMNKTGFPFKIEIYDKLLQSCGKSNSCIRKMKSMCRQANSPISKSETVDTLRDDVCKIKLLKEAIAKHAQHLFNNKMMHNDTTMQKDVFDVVCNGNDKMKMKKHLQMSKIENGIVKRGYLDLDNKMVAWQPVARCTCDYCGSSHDKDDDSGADEETSSEPHPERPPPNSYTGDREHEGSENPSHGGNSGYDNDRIPNPEGDGYPDHGGDSGGYGYPDHGGYLPDEGDHDLGGNAEEDGSRGPSHGGGEMDDEYRDPDRDYYKRK